MGDSEYDLQSLIYTLALHRWLRFRLGAAYDFDTHLGGVRYLFCRGLDAAMPTSPGVHALQPPRGTGRSGWTRCSRARSDEATA